MGLGLLSWGGALMLVAIIHFVRRRPETYWIWIILIGGPIGSFAYIVVEVLPDTDLIRGAMSSWSNGRRLRALEAVVAQNPAVGNREELADLYLERGELARARELYDSVIAARSDSLDARYRRALAALGLNDPAAALTDLEHVVASDPKYDFHRAVGLLAHAAALTGDQARADRLFADATAISTLSETYYNYASFLAEQGRTDEARAWAQRVLDKAPTMPRYLRRRERPWFRKAAALLKRLPMRPARAAG